MNISKKGFANIVFVVIIVVILAGIVGYFMLVKKAPEVVQRATTPTSTQTPVPKSPTLTDKTETWKTYRDDKLGLAFNYPVK